MTLIVRDSAEWNDVHFCAVTFTLGSVLMKMLRNTSHLEEEHKVMKRSPQCRLQSLQFTYQWWSAPWEPQIYSGLACGRYNSEWKNGKWIWHTDCVLRALGIDRIVAELISFGKSRLLALDLKWWRFTGTEGGISNLSPLLQTDEASWSQRCSV